MQVIFSTISCSIHGSYIHPFHPFHTKMVRASVQLFITIHGPLIFDSVDPSANCFASDYLTLKIENMNKSHNIRAQRRATLNDLI